MKKFNHNKISGSPSAGTPASPSSFAKALRGASVPYAYAPRKAITLAEVRQKYAPPVTLGASKEVQLAMDNALNDSGAYSLLQHTIAMGVYGTMSSFLGYGALQNIAQNGLIRACIETVADDMTRNWVSLSIADSNGGNDTDTEAENVDDADTNGNGVDDRLDSIKAEMERLNLREVFHRAASLVGYYGGCLLYLEPQIPSDLREPLVPSAYSTEATSGEHWLKAVKVIDPINIFPGQYNSSNPLSDDFYKPETWWVLGQEVHSSRLIRVVANEPPQLLLPAYNFLGIPQAQILWDYVAHFQQNRDAANTFFNKQSMLLFKTDMANLLAGGGQGLEALDARMNLLAKYRTNDSVVAIDRDAEDLVTQSTPMTGITDVPRQALEFVAALNRTPVVKLLGISPGGFNATGESDLRNYYDHVLSQQEKVFRAPLNTILDIIQMSLFGEKLDGLQVAFTPLSIADKKAQAELQKQKVDTLCALLDRDIISAEEARRILIASDDFELNGLDPDELPVPQDEGMEGMGMGMPMPDAGATEQTKVMQETQETQETTERSAV